MKEQTPPMGKDKEHGSSQDPSLPTSASLPAAEGSVDKANRKSHKGSKNVKSSQLRTGSNSKGNHGQQPSVVQAWRNIFALPRPVKSKPGSQRVASEKKHKKPSGGADGEKHREREAAPGLEQDSSASTMSGARLGKAELGRYAHEEVMPKSLRTLLQGRGESCNSGIVSVLGKLLKIDPSTKVAYLCDPRVQHVAKMSREGSFCGYRNLQMLISYIINAQTPNAQLFAETYPTIFQLQDLIENAWDLGHNSHGRLETGGIKGTRKFIGTPEAQALFSGLGIKCSTQAFRNEEPGRAATMLLDAVFDYFKQKSDQQLDQKLYRTKAAPIYFQHQGHSLTIVGVERKQDGGQTLIVFDPAHRDASIVKALVGSTGKRLPTTTSRLLRPYRCTFRYLSKYKEFELLFLDPSLST